MSKDKQRIDIVPGRKPVFKFSPPELNPCFAQITCACVVPFTREGQLVATILERGIDIPGGHVQVGEKTIDETVRREAFEEAAIKLSELHVLGYLHDEESKLNPSQVTYIACFAAPVETICDFVPSEESLGREILDKEEFLARYEAGDAEGMRNLVYKAYAQLFGKRA